MDQACLRIPVCLSVSTDHSTRVISTKNQLWHLWVVWINPSQRCDHVSVRQNINQCQHHSKFFCLSYSPLDNYCCVSKCISLLYFVCLSWFQEMYSVLHLYVENHLRTLSDCQADLGGFWSAVRRRGSRLGAGISWSEEWLCSQYSNLSVTLSVVFSVQWDSCVVCFETVTTWISLHLR